MLEIFLSTDSNVYSLGDEVPLGILSAWEPCSGILCANIPITYRAAAAVVGHIRLHERTLKRKDSELVDQQQSNGEEQWLPLEDSRRLYTASEAA